MAPSQDASSDQKGPEAYRTISEVAAELDLPQHVLRFWETRFGQIKPLKRAGGRRFYRPQDIELLSGIRHLLYSEGLTIRGVQKVLREQGPRHVAAIGRGQAEPAVAEAPPPRLKPASFSENMEEAQSFFPFPDTPHDAQPDLRGGISRPPALKPAAEESDDDFPVFSGARGKAEVPKRLPERAAKRPADEVELEKDWEEAPAPPMAGAAADPDDAPDDGFESYESEELPKGILRDDAESDTPESGSGFRFLDRLKRDPHSARSGGEGTSLSREDVRDLQAALFELLECKRLLDRVR
ncbi:MerR family transcriptional regulator [Amorphus sp. 3PC139-8]